MSTFKTFEEAAAAVDDLFNPVFQSVGGESYDRT